MSDREPKTHYQVLQLDCEAEPEIISAVYRRLAQRYHPDLNISPEAGSQMRELNAAYSVLRDPTQRKRYDRELMYGPAVLDSVMVPPDPAERGPFLDFGRYRGWTVEQVARVDPDFVDWLARSPNGRHLISEIERIRQQMSRPPDGPTAWATGTSPAH